MCVRVGGVLTPEVIPIILDRPRITYPILADGENWLGRGSLLGKI